MKSVFVFLLFFIVANLSAQSTCPGPDWEINSLEVCYDEYFVLGENLDSTLIYHWSPGISGITDGFKETDSRQIFHAWKSGGLHLNIYDKSYQHLKSVEYKLHVKPSHISVSPQYQFQEPNSIPVIKAGAVSLRYQCMTGYPDYYQPQWGVMEDSTLKSYTWTDIKGNIVGYGSKFMPATPGIYTVKADQNGCHPVASGILYPSEAFVPQSEKKEVISNDLVFDWSIPEDTLGFLDPFPFDICLENKGNRFFEFSLFSGKYPFLMEYKLKPDDKWQECMDSNFGLMHKGLSAYFHPGTVTRNAKSEYLVFSRCFTAYQELLDSMSSKTYQDVWVRIKKTGLSWPDTITVYSTPLHLVLHNYKNDSITYQLINRLVKAQQFLLIPPVYWTPEFSYQKFCLDSVTGEFRIDKCVDFKETLNDAVCDWVEQLTISDKTNAGIVAAACILCEEKSLCRLREEIKSHLDLEVQLKEIQRIRSVFEQIKSMGNPILNSEIENEAFPLVLNAIDDIARQFIGPDLRQYIGEVYPNEFIYFYWYKDINSVLLARLNNLK